MGCVYIATSKTTGKAYVGMTTQTLIKRRNGHHTDTDKGTGNSVFHKALHKYGTSDFIWEELLTSDNEDTLFQKEEELIAAYGTHLPHGYNITSGGRGTKRVAFSVSRRRENRERALKKATPVYCVELDTLFDAMRSAVKETRVATATIKQSINDVFRLVPKYHFCYPDDIEKYRALYKLGQLRYGKPPNSPEAIETTRQKLMGRKQTPEHIEHMRLTKIGKRLPPKTNASIEKWHATSKANGSIKRGKESPVSRVTVNLTDGREFDTLTQAVQFYNLKPSAMGNISQCCRGLKLSAYGYKWAYKNA